MRDNELFEAAKEIVRRATEREIAQARELEMVISNLSESNTSSQSLSDGSQSIFNTDPVPSIAEGDKSVLESISEALRAIAHNTAHIAEMLEAQYFLMSQSMGIDVGNRDETSGTLVLIDEEGNQVDGELSSDQTDRFGEGFYASPRKGTLQ